MLGEKPLRDRRQVTHDALSMTMRWVAQASASGGEQSINPLVTAAWSGAANLFRRSTFLNGALFSLNYIFFTFWESEHADASSLAFWPVNYVTLLSTSVSR